jgi:hypothetical protein
VVHHSPKLLLLHRKLLSHNRLLVDRMMRICRFDWMKPMFN